MAINKAIKLILKAISYANDSVEVERSRWLADLKKLDPMRIFVKKLDEKIYNGDHEVPVRIYFPSQEAMDKGIREGHAYPILLFFHGGGWVTESVENYDRVCAQMAQSTEHIVVSVEYRLAPEYKFPVGLTDCYAVAREIFMNRFILNADPEKITIIGDSAGGNLTAAVCLMARDRKEFFPKRQILIYPAVGNDYTQHSPYDSVRENGRDYLLTARRVEDYMTLYQSSPKDRKNPYFSPIEADDFSHLPKTLILTAEFDPLRDEGEDYARRLKEAGNDVSVYRIADALHGYFALGIKHLHVQESFDLINHFLSDREPAVDHGEEGLQKNDADISMEQEIEPLGFWNVPEAGRSVKTLEELDDVIEIPADSGSDDKVSEDVGAGAAEADADTTAGADRRICPKDGAAGEVHKDPELGKEASEHGREETFPLEKA